LFLSQDGHNLCRGEDGKSWIIDRIEHPPPLFRSESMHYLAGRALAKIYTETLGFDSDTPAFQRA
jgi:hypothetical protein